MRDRIVLWGENSKDEKVLLALELKEKENCVHLYVFPLEVATEEFYNALMDTWKKGNDVAFPDQHQLIERPLSITDSILPEDIRIEKDDILTRAQAEWHFIVLSSKMYEMYRSELEELKEKIDGLSEFKEDVWEEMKGFWEKVQRQVRERNMFQDHASTLKDRTNILFEKLKTLRKQMKKDFEEKSAELAKSFEAKLEEVEDKIKKGIALNPLFEELKEIQNAFYEAQLSRKDKNTVWSKLDGLFKEIKQARFGEKKSSSKGNKSGSRLESRYAGLLKAIDRMEKSIAYDQKDVEFQNNKISTTDGQLEMQIRQAKLVMIEERLNSKKAKLEDMMKTKADLEKMMEKERQRQEAREKESRKKEVASSIKEKISEEIQSQLVDDSEEKAKLREAAEAINESQKKKTHRTAKAKAAVKEAIDQISDAVEEAVEQVVETTKEIVEAVEEKIDELTNAEEE